MAFLLFALTIFLTNAPPSRMFLSPAILVVNRMTANLMREATAFSYCLGFANAGNDLKPINAVIYYRLLSLYSLPFIQLRAEFMGSGRQMWLRLRLIFKFTNYCNNS